MNDDPNEKPLLDYAGPRPRSGPVRMPAGIVVLLVVASVVALLLIAFVVYLARLANDFPRAS